MSKMFFSLVRLRAALFKTFRTSLDSSLKPYHKVRYLGM